MKKKMISFLLAGATAMILFAGCSNNTDSDAKPTTVPTTVPTVEPTAATEVTLGQYKGLVLTALSQKELETEIASMLEVYSEFVEVDRAAENGDAVNINFVGTLDGVAFEGGTNDSEAGFDLILGSHSFIDGFEDGLIGAVAGENRNLNLTFPTEYSQNPDLAGKDVVFAVTVNAVKERVVPELTDAFVSENLGYATVEEYKTELYDAMNKDTLYNQITEAIMTSSEVINYPADKVEDEKALMLEYYMNYAEMYASYYGIDTDTALQYFFGLESTATLETYCEVYAYETVKNALLLEEIAKVEGLELTDEEYQEIALEYALAYGCEDVASFEAEYGSEEVYKVVWIDFVLRYILGQSEVTEAE